MDRREPLEQSPDRPFAQLHLYMMWMSVCFIHYNSAINHVS